MDGILKKVQELSLIHDKVDPRIIEEKNIKLGLRNEDGTGVFVGITSNGMRYSNKEPLQERRIGSPATVVSRRPKANQLSCGNCPWAIATKLESLASEASKS